MKLHRLLIFSCVALLPLSGCSKDKEAETTQVVETVADAPIEEVYEEPIEDESTEETDGAKTAKVSFGDTEDSERVPMPVDYFMTFGKVIKQPGGYSILQADGTYITNSIIPYEDYIYYFNEDGVLTDNVFVDAKSSDGKLVKKYISNYAYKYGFITIDKKTYYVDEDQGLLKSMAVQIDGENYYFDDTGKSISESRYNTLYKNKAQGRVETPDEVAEESLSDTDDMTVAGEEEENLSMTEEDVKEDTSDSDIFEENSVEEDTVEESSLEESEEENN